MAEPYRAIRILHENGDEKELPLGRALSVKPLETQKEFIYLEKMKDGKWQLLWTESTIPDFSKVDLMMIRRD